MANCTKCGQPLGRGLKFCPSCGTAVTSGTAKGSFTKEVAAERVEGAGMGKIAIIAVTAACAVIVLFFFFSYFTVSVAVTGSNSYMSAYLSSSLGDMDTSVSGIGTAFGGSDTASGSSKPSLFLVWLLAIAMLVALYVPKVREKLESIQLPVINIPVIGGLSIFAYLAIIIGLIGLIVYIGVYSSTIGYAKREMAGYDVYFSMVGASIKFQTGMGFKMTVFALLVLLGIPFADKYFLSKRG